MGKEKTYPELTQIPPMASESEMLYYVRHKEVNWEDVQRIKALTTFSDEVIAGWLNINVKTFRSYKQAENRFRDNLKEHILILLSLFKHGYEVFGNYEAFNEWLGEENFHFDGQAPVSFLNTVTGIRFVNERLTAMEYGDNV